MYVGCDVDDTYSPIFNLSKKVKKEDKLKGHKTTLMEKK
jgi:hypothetical protein